MSKYEFLRYAGGKRRIRDRIISRFPHNFNNYYEPFLGGGSIFFRMHETGKLNGKKVFLSDMNKALIYTYNTVKLYPDSLMDRLKTMCSFHSSENYLKFRSEYNFLLEHGEFITGDITLPTLFVYLNQTCYNGLYRVNKSNQFNVPIDPGRTPQCNVEVIMRASKALENTDISCCDYHTIEPVKGDLVYMDPPYLGKFSSYTDLGFDLSDHERLSELAKSWRSQGVKVVISNSNSEQVKNLYRGFDLIELGTTHQMNRQRTTELIIRGLA